MLLSKLKSNSTITLLLKIVSIGIFFISFQCIYFLIRVDWNSTFSSLVYWGDLISLIKLITFNVFPIFLAAYAAWNLWKLRTRGRTAGIILLTLIIFLQYSSYSHYLDMHKKSYLLAGTFLNLIILLFLISPFTKRIISPDRESYFKQLKKYVKTFQPAQLLTIITSFGALIISLVALYFSQFYIRESLLLSWNDFRFDNDEIKIPVVFINDGNVSALILEVNISLCKKKDLSEKHPILYVLQKSTNGPDDEFVIKSGEMKVLKLNILNNAPVGLKLSEKQVMVIEVVSVNSKGLHIKSLYTLGDVSITDGTIEALKRKNVTYYLFDNGSTYSEFFGRNNSKIFKIH